MKIDYYTEPVASYQKGITDAMTLEELKTHLKKYRTIASDALESIDDNFNFKEFKAGLNKERKKKFAGPDWANKYMVIIMPKVLYEASMIAHNFKVPWGLAYIRLIDIGAIKVQNGRAIWIGNMKNRRK